MPLTNSHDRLLIPLPEINVAGRSFSLDSLPPNLVSHPDLGVITHAGAQIERIHLDDFVCHPRAIVLPNGEMLLFHAAGPLHYGWARLGPKGNDMLLRRRKNDTWSDPVQPWTLPYSQHAAIPFIPRGSSTLYAFGTEPKPGHYDGEENAAIGFRRSEDDGKTWSAVTLIRPINALDFQAMSAMRMCETTDGTWLLGAHAGEWSGQEGVDRKVVTRQFLLRSTDQGQTWTLQPGAWPDGWYVKNYNRMDEGRPIALADNRVLLMVRTPTGYLWELRSNDGGASWTEPRPTTLAHPDAPPMLFHLADGKTLAAFHHNKNLPGHMSHENRTELWASLSKDDGLTWSEPRFLLANAAEPAILGGWGGSTPMVSYADLVERNGTLHLFVDHQMRQILHLRFTEQLLRELPTRADLNAYR